MTAILSLAPLLEHFFTQRLIQQRQVSPHTISSYRDTFRQFLIPPPDQSELMMYGNPVMDLTIPGLRSR